ncbi:hypothetical protein MHU86_22098 [Fragilaria crotonensis]|nr:hypothetical protein MHU86_22098 [Fragilaria crotonensis]
MNDTHSLKLKRPPSEQDFVKMQGVAEKLERLLNQKDTLQQQQNHEITIIISRLRTVWNEHSDQRLWSAGNPSDRAIYWMAAFDEYDQLSLQRYAIAVLFFFTSGGDNSWTRCAAPTTAKPTKHSSSSSSSSSISARLSCSGSLPIMTTWSSECDWYGITCSVDGHVTRIEWTSNNLASLGSPTNNANHYWPDEIILLQDLELLWWFDNPRLQMKLPTFLDQMSNLQSLSLHRTNLKGTIPESMYQLTNLISLRLYETELSGTISTAISNLSPNLGWLWLHNTHLTGSIPTELGTLTQLEGLTLYGNAFSNEPPSNLCDLQKLETYWSDCTTTTTTTTTGFPSCQCCSKCYVRTTSIE